MNRVLLSPRGTPPALGDQGERGAFIARQRLAAGAVRRRERARPARVARRRRRLAVGAATVLAAGLLGYGGHWLLTAPRFAVTSVEVRGTSRVTVERVLQMAGIPAGANLWRLDPTTVAARVERLPEVRRADVVRELPNRVTILIEERQPFTLVSAGRLHWLDEEGRVLGEAQRAVAPPVPVISGLSDAEMATLESGPSPRVRQAIALIRALLRTGSTLVSEISEIDVGRRDGPVLYTVDGIEVRLGGEDWDERLARLQGVLGQVATGPDAVRTIDLRFRDQVVLTKGGAG